MLLLLLRLGRNHHRFFRWILACAAIVILLILARILPFGGIRRKSSNKTMSATATTSQQQRDAGSLLERRCSEAVEKLVDLNVNFLAIDFDQTMIDVHTGGRWKESASDLAKHLRPVFLHLIPEATRRNIRVAVVTFSPQTGQIREVLEIAFPEMSELMPIRGNDRTWTYQGNGMRLGKQEHMASAAEEVMARPQLGVTDVGKSTTLLIDDDPRNISKCLKDGTRAIWFNPLDPNRLLDDLLRLE